jgi:subtilisin family serine protease
VKRAILWTFLVLFAYIFGTFAARAEVRILVIDSGVHYSPENLKLCKYGHKDFTGTGLRDNIGHGTNVASLIARELPKSGACIVMYKAFDDSKTWTRFTPYISALMTANLEKFDFINLSIAGTGEDPMEVHYLKQILNNGTRISAASGNNKINLDRGCIIYPACADPRIVVVGAYDLLYSNIGTRVNVLESGKKKKGGGYTMSGTSQATAIYTGKAVAKFLIRGTK